MADSRMTGAVLVGAVLGLALVTPRASLAVPLTMLPEILSFEPGFPDLSDGPS